MQFIELLVIYFSIGAAFGTHRFFVLNSPPISRLLSALSHTVFWPVKAISKFVVYLIPNRSKVSFANSPQTDSIADALIANKTREFDVLLRDYFSGAVLYAYKDVMARYTGITLTISNFDHLIKYEILFTGDQPVSDIQHRCLSRRNHLKLLRHRSDVRSEFVRMLSELMTLAEEPEKIFAMALELVVIIHDPEAVSPVNDVFEDVMQKRREIPVQQLENQSWIAQPE